MRVGVWSLTTKYIGVKLLVNQNKERTFKTKILLQQTKTAASFPAHTNLKATVEEARRSLCVIVVPLV
jgi:hypothetical protein